MKAEKFEDLLVWQFARKLTVEIYRLFEHSKKYYYKDQINRASLSIMNNIAEGFERRSNKDFKQFLFFAKGSSGEVRSMLHLANDLKFIDDDQYNMLLNSSIEISKMISGWISKMQCLNTLEDSHNNCTRVCRGYRVSCLQFVKRREF